MNDPFFKICDSVKSSMEQEATEINQAFKNYFVLKIVNLLLWKNWISAIQILLYML